MNVLRTLCQAGTAVRKCRVAGLAQLHHEPLGQVAESTPSRLFQGVTVVSLEFKGYRIRTVATERFGVIHQVQGTDCAFLSLEDAITYINRELAQ